MDLLLIFVVVIENLKFFSGGGALNKNDEIDVHLPKPTKKVVTYFVLGVIFLIAFFGRFVARGVQKHEKKIPKKSISAHQKSAAFFPSVFFLSPPVVSLRFVFIAFARARGCGSAQCSCCWGSNPQLPAACAFLRHQLEVWVAV
jgi:hypothetical protein